MPKRTVSDDALYEALKRNDWNRTATAKEVGVSPRNVVERAGQLTRKGYKVGSPASSHQIGSSASDPVITIRYLKDQVRQLSRQVLTDELVRREIIKITDGNASPPDWLTEPPRKVTDLTGVPTLFASDWHWAELVRPEEIGGVNAYNLNIARERARTFITVGVDLLKNHVREPRYDGVVFAMGGDMVSGDIHDELKETNELESMPAVLDLLGVLTWCIRTLADEFGRVFCPCVTGNHGRTSRKPRAKRRNHTNFDWLLYQLLARTFADDKRVTFLIPDGADCYYRVYGTRYLLTHGDQFRGGDGFAGAVVPIARGDRKKRSRNLESGHDVMLLGHWHQYTHTGRWIVNGSLKGFDEYAYQGNFEFEEPQQAVWITHPRLGVTFRMPVYVERRGKTEAAGGWVSVPRAA